VSRRRHVRRGSSPTLAGLRGTPRAKRVALRAPAGPDVPDGGRLPDPRRTWHSPPDRQTTATRISSSMPTATPPRARARRAPRHIELADAMKRRRQPSAERSGGTRSSRWAGGTPRASPAIANPRPGTGQDVGPYATWKTQHVHHGASMAGPPANRQRPVRWRIRARPVGWAGGCAREVIVTFPERPARRSPAPIRRSTTACRGLIGESRRGSSRSGALGEGALSHAPGHQGRQCAVSSPSQTASRFPTSRCSRFRMDSPSWARYMATPVGRLANWTPTRSSLMNARDARALGWCDGPSGSPGSQFDVRRLQDPNVADRS